MRKLILISSLIVFVLFVNAAVWRLSKDATYLPHYSEIQAAIDGAEAGDSIYVYPGNYGNATIKKKIAVFGVGYFLIENDKDSLTLFTTPSNLGTIAFKPGSDNSTISGTSSSRITCDSVSNIYLSGVNAGGVTLNTCNNTLIVKSYFTDAINTSNSRNILINNNIVLHHINIDVNSGCYLINNFLKYKVSIHNSVIQNNFFSDEGAYEYYGWRELSGFANCRIEKNIFRKIQPNIDNYSANNYFANFNDIFVSQIKADKYLLNDTSIAKGKGVGGVDCGPYGGDDPYCPSGIVMIPTIVRISIPTKASAESGLKIKAIIKSSKP